MKRHKEGYCLAKSRKTGSMILQQREAYRELVTAKLVNEVWKIEAYGRLHGFITEELKRRQPK